MLKLHTEGFDLGADFHEVAAPIDGGLGLLEHHLTDRPDFGHDLG